MSANIKASVDGTQAIIGVGGVDQMTVSNAGVVTANSFVGSVLATGSTTARTLANRFADVVNVRDFGAVGDGVTNDTAAINQAKSTLTDYKTLFFPSGKYKVTAGGISAFENLHHICVAGEGRSSVIYSDETGGPNGFFVFQPSCDYVTIRDFDIVGSATSRAYGVGIRLYSSDSIISNIRITKTSDFGILVSNEAGGYTSRVIVDNCTSYETRGDGFHVGHVTDCIISNCSAFSTWDDGLGIGDDNASGNYPNRIQVSNFTSIQAGNPASGGGNGVGIRIFDGASNVNIIGGIIKESATPGLYIGRFWTTNTYNKNIIVNGLQVYSCLQVFGNIGNIDLNFADNVSLVNCWSEAPAQAFSGCFTFSDCQNLTVKSCTAKNPVLRGFMTNEGFITDVANTWSNWEFSSNTVIGTPNDAPYYIVPPIGKSISNLIMVNNTEIGSTFSNFITTRGLSTEAIIANNTSMSGKSIVNVGSGIVPRTFNNNFGVRGANNTANGVNALVNNTSGDSNTGIGAGTLETNTVGYGNTALGRNSLNLNTDGYLNSAIGLSALRNNGSAHSNTGIGTGALESNVSGNLNTGIGRNALNSNVSFSNCSGLGYNAQVTGSNQVQLGDSATTTYAYGAVQNRSDIRDKTDIRDTTLGLEFVNSLRPVDYKLDMREDYRKEAPSFVSKPAELKEDASEEDKVKYAEELDAYNTYKVEFDKWIEDGKLANITHDGSKKRNRFHHGLIAQEVKAVLDAKGIDFGGFQDHSIKGGDDVLSIGYAELIAPMLKAIQELSAEVAALKSK